MKTSFYDIKQNLVKQMTQEQRDMFLIGGVFAKATLLKKKSARQSLNPTEKILIKSFDKAMMRQNIKFDDSTLYNEII